MAKKDTNLSAIRKELQICIDRLQAVESKGASDEALQLEGIAVDIGRLSTELLRIVAKRLKPSDDR
jgi:hypothetical protein